MLQDVGFERFLDGIGEFHARVREELYSVVVIRIVRRGDDHAGLKIILADETRHARRRYDARASNRGAAMNKAGGKERANVWPGFARVHADERVGFRVFAAQESADGAADRVKGGVVERKSSGNAADPIRSEEFFGHEILGAVPDRDDPNQSNTRQFALLMNKV